MNNETFNEGLARGRRLDEARQLVAREECAANGHDWEVIEEVGTGPTQLLCARCGKALTTVAEEGFLRASTAAADVTFPTATANRSTVVAAGAGKSGFDIRQLESHGRDVTVTAGCDVDEHGQFRVALYVDGKERYAAHFTPKDEKA